MMEWEALEGQAQQHRVPTVWLLREKFQLAMLYAMADQDAFTSLVFQGGTALRLCHGNPRFSEDLDFVCRANHLIDRGPIEWESLVQKLHNTFPWMEDLTSRTQKATPNLQRIILASHLPNQSAFRVHVEIARVPAYDVITQPLTAPQGTFFVAVESSEEILADKIVAVGLRPYIKGRDVWDISFLRTQGRQLPIDYIPQKLGDYGSNAHVFRNQVVQRAAALRHPNVQAQLRDELARFVPAHRMSALTERDAWTEMAEQTASLLDTVRIHPAIAPKEPSR